MNKLKLYEKLGAKKFKKVVLKVEKIKYLLLKPFSNKIINYREKLLDRQLEKMLRKETNEEKKKQLIIYYNKEKLRTRIEFNNKENRNYHFNYLNPKETLYYLNINKNIHIKGIKSNIIYIVASSLALTLSSGIIIPILISVIGLNVFSLFINFECINLQNYNITRLNQKLNKLTILKEKSLKKKYETYKEITTTLSPLMEKKTGVTKDDIINNITTKKQIDELNNLLDEAIKRKERKLKL